MSDLQEEGRHAIDSPMSPASVDVHPEDTVLGKAGPAGPPVVSELAFLGVCPGGLVRLTRGTVGRRGLRISHHPSWRLRVGAPGSRSRLEKAVGKTTSSSESFRLSDFRCELC